MVLLQRPPVPLLIRATSASGIVGEQGRNGAQGIVSKQYRYGASGIISNRHCNSASGIVGECG